MADKTSHSTLLYRAAVVYKECMEWWCEMKSSCLHCRELLELESCVKLPILRLLFTNFQWNTLATNHWLSKWVSSWLPCTASFLLVCFCLLDFLYTTSLFCQVISSACVPHIQKLFMELLLVLHYKPSELKEQTALGHFGPTELFDHDKCNKATSLLWSKECFGHE